MITLKEIQNEWKRDSVIDQTDLFTAALENTKLHHKYITLWGDAKQAWEDADGVYQVFRFERKAFHLDGPNEKTKANGWVPLTASGRKFLKTEIEEVLKGDPLMREAEKPVRELKLVVDTIESIVKMIMKRNYDINTALEFRKFMAGSR